MTLHRSHYRTLIRAMYGASTTLGYDGHYDQKYDPLLTAAEELVVRYNASPSAELLREVELMSNQLANTIRADPYNFNTYAPRVKAVSDAIKTILVSGRPKSVAYKTLVEKIQKTIALYDKQPSGSNPALTELDQLYWGPDGLVHKIALDPANFNDHDPLLQSLLHRMKEIMDLEGWVHRPPTDEEIINRLPFCMRNAMKFYMKTANVMPINKALADIRKASMDNVALVAGTAVDCMLNGLVKGLIDGGMLFGYKQILKTTGSSVTGIITSRVLFPQAVPDVKWAHIPQDHARLAANAEFAALHAINGKMRGLSLLMNSASGVGARYLLSSASDIIDSVPVIGWLLKTMFGDNFKQTLFDVTNDPIKYF